MAQPGSSQDIDSVLHERRVFPPPAEFAAQAHVKSMDEWQRLARAAADDPEAFWAAAARELHWFKPWDKVLEWNPPCAKWFVGGKIKSPTTASTAMCTSWRRNKAAIIWEGEPGEAARSPTGNCTARSARFANVLKSLGVGKGDRVAIYMPMVPELAIAHAGLRAHRRRPHRGLRRLLRRSAARPHQRRAGHGAHHRRRRLPPRPRDPAASRRSTRRLRSCPTVEHVVVVRRTGDRRWR